MIGYRVFGPSLLLLLAGCVAGVSLDPGRLMAAPGAAELILAPGQSEIHDRLNRISVVVVSGQGDINDAIRELHGILALDPRVAEAHLLLGLAYQKLGSPEFMAEAKAEFQQALDLNPDFVPARFHLASMHLQFGRMTQAREQLEAGLAHTPRQPQLLALLGDTERRLGNPQRALELNRQALEVNPSFVQARYYVALALLDLERRDEGIQELEAVTRSGPLVPDVHLSLGAAYLEAGRAEEALAALTRGIEIDPARPDIRLQLARAYRSLGRLVEAEAQLMLAMPTGDAAAATASRQRLESDLYLEQGLIRQQQGELAAAAAALRRSLQMDGTRGRVHRHLAEVYLALGDYGLASGHAVQAEALGSPLQDDIRQSLQDALRALPGAPR